MIRTEPACGGRPHQRARCELAAVRTWRMPVGVCARTQQQGRAPSAARELVSRAAGQRGAVSIRLDGTLLLLHRACQQRARGE